MKARSKRQANQGRPTIVCNGGRKRCGDGTVYLSGELIARFEVIFFDSDGVLARWSFRRCESP